MTGKTHALGGLRLSGELTEQRPQLIKLMKNYAFDIGMRDGSHGADLSANPFRHRENRWYWVQGHRVSRGLEPDTVEG